MDERSDVVSEREELERVADNIYDIDYPGIVLNAALAALGGLLASITGVTVGDASQFEAAMLFVTSFTPMFTVKVVAEYAKQRAVKEGQVKAWMQGVRESDKVRINVSPSDFGVWINVYRLCNSASLVRHGVFDL